MFDYMSICSICLHLYIHEFLPNSISISISTRIKIKNLSKVKLPSPFLPKNYQVICHNRLLLVQSPIKWDWYLSIIHCRFLVPDRTQKNLTEIWLKMMVKKGLQKLFWNSKGPSEIPARPIQPFWADCFALGSSNSEGHRGILKEFF